MNKFHRNMSQNASNHWEKVSSLFPFNSNTVLATNKDKLFLLATWHLVNNLKQRHWGLLQDDRLHPPPPHHRPQGPKGLPGMGGGVKTCCTPVVRAWKLLKLQNLQISPKIIASATIFWHARWVTGPRIRQWASQDSKLGSWVCSLVLEGL